MSHMMCHWKWCVTDNDVNFIKVKYNGTVDVIAAAPIPLIEASSIPLPIQDFSHIIDDLNVGTIPLDIINSQPETNEESISSMASTSAPQEVTLGDDLQSVQNSGPSMILTSSMYFLFYWHLWIKSGTIKAGGLSITIGWCFCERITSPNTHFMIKMGCVYFIYNKYRGDCGFYSM